LLLVLHLLLLAPLVMVTFRSPLTRIHHLPDEQDGVGFDVADEEDERAVESYGWHAGHGHGRRGGCYGVGSVLVDGNNGLVVQIAEEQLAGVGHRTEVRSAEDERVRHAQFGQRIRELER